MFEYEPGFIPVPGVTVLTAARTPIITDLTFDLSDKDYNGLAQGVTVTGLFGMGDITVKYNGSTAVPVDSGTYAVSVDIAAGNFFFPVTNLNLGIYTINPKLLTWNTDSVTVSPRTYQSGNTTANIDGQLALSGVIASDTVNITHGTMTGTFNNDSVGTDKLVTIIISGYSIDNRNYLIPRETTFVKTGDITPITSITNPSGGSGGGGSSLSETQRQIMQGAKTVNLKLGKGQRHLTIHWQDIRLILEEEVNLRVTDSSGKISIVFTSDALKDSAVRNNASLEVNVTQIPDIVTKANVILAAEFTVTQSNNRIDSFKTPVNLSFDLSGLSLDDTQGLRLTGAHFNAEGTVTLISGRFNSDDNIFSFDSNSLSIYGVLQADEAELVPEPEPVEKEPVIEKSDIKLEMTIGSTSYKLNDTVMNMDVVPMIRDDRTLMPLRFVSEAFGADVTWDEASRTAIISLEDKALNVTIGQIIPEAGLDTPAIIENNRMLVPIRYVLEELGAEVKWHRETQTITITKIRSFN